MFEQNNDNLSCVELMSSIQVFWRSPPYLSRTLFMRWNTLSTQTTNLSIQSFIHSDSFFYSEPEPIKLTLRRRNVYVYPPDTYKDADLPSHPPEERLQLEWV